MSIKEALDLGIKNLLKTSSSPSLDSEVLLSFVLSSPPFSPSAKRKGETRPLRLAKRVGRVERGFLYAHPDYKLSKLQAKSYKLLIQKRANHWPIAYLVGHKEFYGLDFRITPAVLIPRPETELLVELALSSLFSPSRREGGDKEGVRRKRALQVIDLGTGSGNIIVSLAKKLTEYAGSVHHTPQFYGVDSSKKALQIARRNARRQGVAHRIKFLPANLLDPLSALPLVRGRKSWGHSYLILANLPYLTPHQYSTNPDLRREPRQALIAGPDGLKYYRELFEQLRLFLPSSPGDRFDSTQGRSERSRMSEGRTVRPPRRTDQERLPVRLLLEHDPSQKNKLKGLAKKYFPLARLIFHKDLSGKYRVMEITL